MSTYGAALEALEKVVGAEHLVTATGGVATLTGGVSEFCVDDQMPFAVAHPGTEEQVAEVLRVASAHGLSVLPRGAGRHLYLGNVPEPIGVLLCLNRLNQVVEYDANDLTITVQAGMTLGELQRLTATHRQLLPLDPPGAEEATVGGVAAANLSGPLRMYYGAPRDLILGLRAAQSDGTIIRTGARTVKNVAGYDLTKLFVGSVGSLGALLEVTLRLVPQMEERALFAASLSLARARETVAALIGGPLDIATCDLLNHAAATEMKLHLPLTLKPDDVVLFVGVMGASEAVARQGRELRSLLPEGVARLEREEIGTRVRDLPRPAKSRNDSCGVRLRVPLTATVDALEAVSARLGWRAVARAGEGTVFALGPAHLDTLTALRNTAIELGGHAVLEYGPVETKRAFGVWGEVANLDLMRALKQALDPSGAMGCGRLVR